MFVTLPLRSEVRVQMDIVDEFLNLIKDEGWSTIVAGGAPRDWFFNTKAKDIDIFLPPMDIESLVSTLTTKYKLTCVTKLSEDISEEYRSPNLLAVIDFKYKRTSFQFIVQTININPLTHFGCSLSLITYENFNIKPDRNFLRSIKYSEMTVLNSCNANYIRKNILKFPNYRIKFQNAMLTNTPFVFENEPEDEITHELENLLI